METENKDREMIKALNQMYKELYELRAEESNIERKILEKREQINILESEISQRMIEKRRVE